MQRTIVITGAAGGIGQALVKEFSDDGYDVIATDIVSQPREIECAHYFQVDLIKMVEDELYATSIFSSISDILGGSGLNALVNNAAKQILGGVDSLTRQDWKKTIDVNLIAPFLWTQALLSDLEKAGGSVLNISSIHAKLTKKNFVAYATSKAALSGMTRAMALDLGGRIRVNAIELGAVETKMLEDGFENNPSLYESLQAYHPVGRIGTTSEVCKLVRLLIDDEISFMSGSCIPFDGGISSRLFDPL